MISGQRRAERSQLCLTNPEVLRIAIDTVLEWTRDNPDASIFSVSQNDTGGWCECDRCRRVQEEEGGVVSGPLLRFVNQVADAVAQQHPDKLIDTLAYADSLAAPSLTRPRPNPSSSRNGPEVG